MNDVIALAGRIAALSPMTLPVVIKATALLLVALLLSSALRRASASARHTVWHLALAGLIAIPMLARVLPGWRLPVPGSLAALPFGALVASYMHPASGALPVDSSLAGPPRDFALAAEKPPASAATGAIFRAISTSATSAPAPVPRLGFRDVVSLVWAAGALALLGWLILGHIWLDRVARRSTAVNDESWMRSVHELSARLGLRRQVNVLRSDAAVIPATCGLFKPALLLPASADQWPAAHRSSVLCHELAHVKRFDCLTQLVAQLACALFWFHPGAWYAARRLLVEREHACDDMVLMLGTRPSDYASHLIDMARSLAPARISAPATVSMARPSQLEGRLLAVLDPRRRRTRPLRSLGKAPTLAMLAIVLPLAAVEADGKQLSLPSAPAAPALTSAERRIRALVGTAECAASAEQTLMLPVADARRVEVEADGGALFIEGRPGISRIRVLGIACAARVHDLDDLRLLADRHRESVEVETRVGRHAHGAQMHILVELPLGMAVDVDDAGGDTEIRGVGRLRIDDGSGKLYIEHARGDVRVEDGAGDIDIRDVAGSVKVTEDEGGDLRVAGIRGSFEVEHRGAGLIDWLDVEGEIHVPRIRQ